MSSSSSDPLQFGILPSTAVANLTPNTDWRDRSAAIDTVHASILRTTDAALFLPYLGPLITFLTALILTDPNFKVVLITLRALDDLIAKAGLAIKPQLSTLVPTLLEKLADGKVILRQAIFKVLANTMHILGPRPVLGLATHFLSHDHPKIREDTVNVVILALLTFPITEMDPSALTADLMMVLADAKPKVKYVAVEAYAVLAAKTGTPDKVLAMVQSLGVDEETLGILRARFTSPMYPVVGADGMVDHILSQQYQGGGGNGYQNGGAGAAQPVAMYLPPPSALPRMNMKASALFGMEAASSPVKATTTVRGGHAAIMSAPTPLVSLSTEPADDSPAPPTHPAPTLKTPRTIRVRQSALVEPSPIPSSASPTSPTRSSRQHPLPPLTSSTPPPTHSRSPPAAAPPISSIDRIQSLVASLHVPDDQWDLQSKTLSTLSTLPPPTSALPPPLISDLYHTVATHVLNLRSAVSRSAIHTLGHLATWTPSSLTEAELIYATLMRKLAGTSADFVVDAVDAALGKAALSIPFATRGVASALVSAAESKSHAVRAKAAAVLEWYLRPAAGGMVGGGAVDKVMVGLLKDPIPATRARARRMIARLARAGAGGPEWVVGLKKVYGDTAVWEDIQRALALVNVGDEEGVARRPDGLPDFTTVLGSVSGGVGMATSPIKGAQRPSSAPKAAGRGGAGGILGGIGSLGGASGSDASMVSPEEVLDRMGSKDWKTRLDGIHDLHQLLSSTPTSLFSTPGLISRLMDVVSDRLRDGNHRVSTAALQALGQALVPAMGTRRLEAYIFTLFPSVVASTIASQTSVRQAALGTADVLIAKMDAMCMIQALGNVLTNGSTGGGGGGGGNSSNAAGPLPKARAWVLDRARGVIERTTNPPLRLQSVLKCMLPPVMRILTNDRDRGSDAEASASALVQSLASMYGNKALAEAVVTAPGVTSAAEVMNVLSKCLPGGGSGGGVGGASGKRGVGGTSGWPLSAGEDEGRVGAGGKQQRAGGKASRKSEYRSSIAMANPAP